LDGSGEDEDSDEWNCNRVQRLERMEKIRRTSPGTHVRIRRFRQGTRRSSSNARAKIDTLGNSAAGCKYVFQPVAASTATRCRGHLFCRPLHELAPLPPPPFVGSGEQRQCSTSGITVQTSRPSHPAD